MTDVVYVHEGGRQKTGETKRKEKKGKADLIFIGRTCNHRAFWETLLL
jgi:hypothetical protein